MNSNLDRYKKALDALIIQGELLDIAMEFACHPERLDKFLTEGTPEERAKAAELRKGLPDFAKTYQTWYSEAKLLIRQLLPDRLDDFVRHYEPPKPRKALTCESYRIEDYLQGLSVTRGAYRLVGPDSAIPHFQQQLAIAKSVKARFTSSLFDIRQILQGDLFDNELDAARELAKNKFPRAAGAMAGVVLERHLLQVCQNHTIRVTKKNPCISDLNNLLKEHGVLDVPTWRFVQHLADIRNTCDHSRNSEPTTEQVADLVAGVAKMTKTLF